jgi:TetR/AcrR family transcriptional regulator, ethionamide resistance regulator
MVSVTRNAQPSRADRRASLERRLLTATERLMQDEGLAFTELSVDRLANEAGISRATFYVYFEDKGQLLRLLARKVMDEISGAARRWWQIADRRDPNDLRAAIRSIVHTYRKHSVLMAAVVETASYDAAVAAEFDELIGEIRDSTREVIESGQEAGAVRSLPTTQVASALTWMVERVCHQMVRSASADDDELVIEALTQIIWNTLYLEPASAVAHHETDESAQKKGR